MAFATMHAICITANGQSQHFTSLLPRVLPGVGRNQEERGVCHRLPWGHLREISNDIRGIAQPFPLHF